MDHLFWIVALVVALKVAVVATLYVQKRRDAERRQVKRVAIEERRRREEEAQVVEDTRTYFPDAAGTLAKGLDTSEALEPALRGALGKVKGTRVGQVRVTIADRPMTVPAVWPHAQRGKGGYLVGRTGSGKTTLLLRCAKANIDAGEGVGVIAPERELFVETLLPLCAGRADDTIYFAPGDSRCPIQFNPMKVEPGDDPARCAAEVYNVLKRVMGADTMGARTGPILANALTLLVGRGNSTLLDVKKLFEDKAFREAVLRDTPDGYVRDFWTRVYPTYPANAHVPAVNRLDEFMRYRQLRRALCSPGTLSIRQVLAENRVLLVDLGQLDADSTLLTGQLILARIQVELMRREKTPTARRSRFFLYCDEFQVTAGVAQESWRALLSRGRRYGLALTLAHQFPSQVPVGVRDEILSNVSSIAAFTLGSRDSEVVRKELLYRSKKDGSIRPVPLEALVNQPVGHAVAKLATGAMAFPLQVDPPVEVPGREVGERVREISWKKFGAPAPVQPDVPEVRSAAVAEPTRPAPTPGSGLNEMELKFLQAVVEKPGLASGEYAKLTGLNGTRAARIRKKLIAAGCLREHKLARKSQGKPALILEPLAPGRSAVAAPAEVGS